MRTGDTTKYRKGDRVLGHWPGLGNGPTTGWGTILRAHRDGTVTVLWDTGVRRKQWVDPRYFKMERLDPETSR